jgi:gluconate 2-dehydrogenase gamma chain
MRRREFITVPLAAAGGTLFYVLARQSARVESIDGKLRVPLRFFTEAEARVVAAACERIFPADASGPGASDAGVVVYIDRQLAGPYGRDKYRYAKPPFAANPLPQHGYQGSESPRQIYRTGIRSLTGFADLTGEEQDRKLLAVEKTRFFQLLRTHTIEGVFCDPMHGGNVDLVGWKLIGYPGPRMDYRNEIDRHFGEAFRPEPASLRQITGQPVVPSEDEND